MNYFVYILQSQINHSFYIGQTSNIENRFKRHNAGSERYTKKYTPWNLIWFQACDSRAEAMKFENQIKAWKSRKRIIKHIIKNPCITGSVNAQISDLIHLRESS